MSQKCATNFPSSTPKRAGSVPRCFCGCGRRTRLRDWNAARHGQRTGRLVQSLTTATEMLNLDAHTIPAYTRLVTAAHDWQDVWASVVHSGAQSQNIDHHEWTQWRDNAIAMLDRLMDAYEARWLEGATAAELQRETDQLWTPPPRVPVREQCRDRQRPPRLDRARHRRRRDRQQSP